MRDIDSIVHEIATQAANVCGGMDLDPDRLEVTAQASTGRVRVTINERSIPIGTIVDRTFECGDATHDLPGKVRAAICAQVAARRCAFADPVEV